MFGYSKTPDIMLFIVSSQKLDWTHTFDTHCMQKRYRKFYFCYYFSVVLAGASELTFSFFITEESSDRDGQHQEILSKTPE